MTCPIRSITIKAQLLSPSKHSWMAEVSGWTGPEESGFDAVVYGFSPSEALGKIALEIDKRLKSGAWGDIPKSRDAHEDRYRKVKGATAT